MPIATKIGRRLKFIEDLSSHEKHEKWICVFATSFTSIYFLRLFAFFVAIEIWNSANG
jgi:hypothetical protein